ncbi:galactose-1-phosphate uridylyltransferase [Alloscardovia theropitheci]|uniref:Galactose-1-phosphate uridylyltransferase n=1 Tax=Alloscardovia theropitheci TaxID=2496842 RepID=A0A4R0QP31_9BIFI|nr:galactose-1-phosphate uridylyltransferase [Alloscardovia theropitheci]TCD53954.1 galactose-1-phosphate uridylyltransferase [Alloscardovia theropitheci]
MKEIYGDIERLIECAIDRLELDPLDVDFVRNKIIELLGLDYFPPSSSMQSGIQSSDTLDEGENELIEDIIIDFVGHAVSLHLIEREDSATLVDQVLNILSPSPALVNSYFEHIEREDSPEDAMDWLYCLCEANGSVHSKQLDTNPHFASHGLVITINTAKPEFTTTKKAALGNSTHGGYPQCVICHENEGLASANKRTLRTVAVELGGKQWFWQFSPYGYFYQHGICVNNTHTPMKVDRETIRNIIDFVDRFPHFFLGCNAALPRIGGSILAHDHYQGGGQLLPMHTCTALKSYTITRINNRLIETYGSDGSMKNDQPLLILEILDWPGSAIRLISHSRLAIEEVSELIRLAWSNYANDQLHIQPVDDDGNQQSSVSPSVIKTSRGYEMNLIFRNNAISEELPDGIFHARPQYFSIKQEAIGLIEAQGLFILPGRLVHQLRQIEDALLRGEDLPQELEQFRPQWDEINTIVENRNNIRTREAIHRAIEDELGSVCYRILENTAVFPTKESLEEFITEIPDLEMK